MGDAVVCCWYAARLNSNLNELTERWRRIIDCQFAEPIGTTYSLAISMHTDRLEIGGEDGTIHIW